MKSDHLCWFRGGNITQVGKKSKARGPEQTEVKGGQPARVTPSSGMSHSHLPLPRPLAFLRSIPLTRTGVHIRVPTLSPRATRRLDDLLLDNWKQAKKRAVSAPTCERDPVTAA